MAADEDERCAKAQALLAIGAAFERGDLGALRAAVGDPGLVPNGRLPDGIGCCLVHAIYHSPFPFIRTLLELGADPNVSVDDGFPPLIAALGCGRDVPGGARRDDVDEIVRLLLTFGADPNQRGINDYTALHMAVAERRPWSLYLLLAAGADPELRTRIDECETARDMAQAAGLDDLVAILDGSGRGRRRLRSGLTLLVDAPGHGEPVRRQRNYRIRLRLWLHKGEAVRWPMAWGPVGKASLEDNGESLVTEVRIDRRSLIAGLFYGVEGMRVGGTRRLEIAPHLAYAGSGVPEAIPPGALLTAEISVLEEASWRGRVGT